MNLIATPKNPIRPSPQGRISITIGKVAVDWRRDKARPCHRSGTEVIGHETASYVTRNVAQGSEPDAPFGRLRSLRAGSVDSRGSPRSPRQARGRHFAAQKALAQDDRRVLCWLMSVSIFRFSALTWRRNNDGREIAFCGQLSKSGQFKPLQIIPAAEQLCALPLQLLELKLLGCGGG